MLRAFRSGGVAQVMAGAIVFAIIIVFVLEFRSGAGQQTGSLQVECAVNVGSSCVAAKDFFSSYGLIVPRGASQKQLRELGLRRKVLEGLVERELLIAEAKRLGISISEQEVDASLAEGKAHVSFPVSEAMLAAQLELGMEGVRLIRVKNSKTNEFDYDVYTRSVRNYAGLSPKDFKDSQRRELVAHRMRQLVRARVRLSEAEAFEEFERVKSKAVARAVRVHRDWVGRWVVDASDAVVAAWADANRTQIDAAWKTAKEGWVAGCPLVSEIMVEVETGSSDQTKTLERDLIEKAAARIAKKEPFERVARQTSEGSTALSGGHLGCLNEGYGDGAKDLLAHVEKMKPGEVSPVLETARGFHVLLLHGKLPEADVEKTARRIIERRLAVSFAMDQLTKEIGGKLITAAKGGKKLAEAADEIAREYALRGYHGKKPGADETLPALEDELRPKLEVTTSFNPSGTVIDGVLPGRSLASQMFALEKAEDVLPDFVETMTGLAVLQLKEKTVAGKEDFAKEKHEVVQGLLLAKQMDALARYVAALRSTAGASAVVNPRFAEESTKDADGTEG